MFHSWVLNASPLILLGKAELLHVIGPLANKWVIPNGVLEEVSVKSPVDAYLGYLSACTEVETVTVEEINPFVAAWDLGRGESEVISIALVCAGAGAVLDDFQARKCASVLNIPLVGSVGLILKARRENIIPIVKPSLERLVSVGLYMDPKTISRVLEAVGE